MSCKTDEKAEKEECEEEKKKGEEEEEDETDWSIWTNPLEELSEIEDAFEADGKNRLHGKTVLDVGTDCVKPLYIALKFEPCKIIGISDDLPDFSSELAQKSRLFTKTRIRFYGCNFFDKETLKKILRDEKIKKFDFVLVSKTLHHLRTGECVAKKRDPKHEHREHRNEKCCIYKFEEQEIFEQLLQLGNKVIIFECFYPQEKDDDKVRGRGGHFTRDEWKQIFRNLSKHYGVELIRPLKCHLHKGELEGVNTMLRQVDCICFYVKTK